MFNLMKTTAAASVLTVVLAAAGLATGAGTPSEPPGPVRCNIEVTASGAMIAFAGVVHADMPVTGVYSFRVSGGGSGGSSNISQGGPFAAGPGEPVTLGSVTVGAAGADYTATLEVTANGIRLECRERFGRFI